MDVKSFLNLIRWKNVLIVLLVTLIFRWALFKPFLGHIPFFLSNFQFCSLVFALLIVTMTGNIVNDIYDVAIDRINKPTTQIISRTLSVKKAWWIYGILVAIGLVVSVFLAIIIKKPYLATLFPLTVLMLWVYSAFLKKTMLFGNIIVALMSSLVLWVVYLSELPSLHLLDIKDKNQLLNILYIYFVFAFSISFFREIIKDMEDIEADRLQRAKTFPILFGVLNTKILASSVLIGIMIVSIIVGFQYASWLLWIGVLLLLIYLLVIGFYLWKASKKKAFNTISQLSKILMLMGVIALVLIGFFY